MSNHLAKTHSPYLLQHQDNPVDWYPWCDEAFSKAKLEDKPIFLSIGYSTCHWCHVMAHESFEDAQVAEILNREFVPIKVDREERPDIDAVYMQVCQAMTGSGGWPLTIFMTPDQKPFYAATYLPKYSQYRRAGLLDTLLYLADVWKRDRDRLLRSGEQLSGALNRTAKGIPGTPEPALADAAFSEFQQIFDAKWGGFGGSPKFPSAHNLLFLLDYADRTGNETAMAMVRKTLDAMADGGIFDQIGGGFARYSTDGRWLKPHFEKMLYDNALLLLAYTEAYQRTGEARYAGIARATAEYVLREMTHPDGGFYSAQDADSEGIEGKYYLFSESELGSVLGERDFTAFQDSYALSAGIINRIDVSGARWDPDDARLKKLLQYRQSRMKLHTDDKILTAWNAWMVLALARAGSALRERKYLDAAVRAERFLRIQLTDKQNRLFLSWHAGSASIPGQLDDYAVYSLALMELYRDTLDTQYLQQAVLRAKQMLEWFRDSEHGGCFRTASDAEQLIARPKEYFDGAMPSGNSCAAMALQQLAEFTGEQQWHEAAEQQLRFVSGRESAYPTGAAYGLLAVLRAVFPHRELVVCAEQLPEELTAFLEQHPANDLTVLWKCHRDKTLLTEIAPFSKDYAVPKEGCLWYLCRNGACALPVHSFRDLKLT